MKTIMIAVAAAFFSLNVAAHNLGEDPNSYCVMNKNGKTVIEHNGKTITKDVRFKNGSIIKPNGTVLLASGKTVKLQEGECVDENSIKDLSTRKNTKEFDKETDPNKLEGEDTWNKDYNQDQTSPDNMKDKSNSDINSDTDKDSPNKSKDSDEDQVPPKK